MWFGRRVDDGLLAVARSDEAPGVTSVLRRVTVS